MPSSEFSQWRAYYSLVPFEDVKEDIRLGLLRTSILAASSRQFKKIEMRDLVPTWELKPNTGDNLAQRMAANVADLKRQIESRKHGA